MTLRQLEYLIAVAQAGSFVQAAETLGVSQPTLSQQIRALEAEVGGALLDRTHRQVLLTPAGKALIGDAQAAVISAHRAIRAARRALRAVPEVLTLATVRSIAVAVLPETIMRWHEARPEVTIRIHELANRTLVAAAVRQGHADLGIGPLPDDWAGARVELGWEQLVLVLPRSDPLSHAEGPVELGLLSRREWVLYKDRHGLGEQVLAACQAAGFEPQCAVRTAQVEAAARFAAAGIGPSLVPVKNVPADLVPYVRGVEPPIAWRVWCYTTSRSFTGTAATFADMLTEAPWQKDPFVDPTRGTPVRPG
jgi:DNA-binding transcriptional LysR family regulator